jgi:hypothetical protein
MLHLFLTSALDGELPDLRSRRPLNMKLGGPQPVFKLRKRGKSPPTDGNRTRFLGPPDRNLIYATLC